MRGEWKAAAVAVAAVLGYAPAMAQQDAGAQALAAAPDEEVGPPKAPAGLVASLALPAQDAGGYLTPNRGLSAAETVWHLRVALNVAALGCRGPGEAATVARYNALLASEKAALAAASDGAADAYKARYGAAWQAHFDDDMTRLYNFWAQPAAHDGLCEAADAVLKDAAVVEPSDFGAFAAVALPQMEQPFLAFFASVDRYRTALAGWKAAHAPAVMVAAAAPVQVAGGALP